MTHIVPWQVYEKSSEGVLRHIGDYDTKREANAARYLTKELRKNGKTTVLYRGGVFRGSP